MQINYLEKHNLLTDKQYGFCEKHSTCMALLDLIHHVTEELDSKKYSLGIFDDLSKAFGTTNHNII